MPPDAQPPTAPADAQAPAPVPSTDALFKRLVTIFTALSLAGIYGWLAGFARQTNGDLSFQWRWAILPWALIGLGSTAWFWRKIWPPPNRPEATRKDILAGSIVLLAPGLWWLVLPLRSLSGQHFWDVTEGLTAAAIVLSFGAWALVRLGRAFEESDNIPPGPQPPAPGDAADKGPKK